MVDFAHHYLAIEDPPSVKHMNVGLPLDLVNLLRLAPPSLLDPPSGPDGLGWRQGELGNISRRWDVAESHEASAARSILREFAYQEFESSNCQLAAMLGWPIDHFIVRGDEQWRGASTADLLAELERLWTPRASASVLDYMFAALGELWSPRNRA